MIYFGIVLSYKVFAKFLFRDILPFQSDRRLSVSGYFQKFHNSSGTGLVSGMPYLHYLRNHLADLILFYEKNFGWGYGFLSTNAGKHLNKRIKYYELLETNLSSARYTSYACEAVYFPGIR